MEADGAVTLTLSGSYTLTPSQNLKGEKGSSPSAITSDRRYMATIATAPSTPSLEQGNPWGGKKTAQRLGEEFCLRHGCPGLG